MIDEQDFSVVESELDPAPLDDADEPPLDADAAAGQPLVVIEYRNRVLPTLLLLPPLLALVLGVVIVYFRAQIADWPGIRELRIVPRAAVVHRPA
ncbi:MAG TPA: hypothetical protein VGZ22_24790, partial [Isosphaeraceae bacterium]|nr:hypothetical protein [Isosphaeraceae bacterium]